MNMKIEEIDCGWIFTDPHFLHETLVTMGKRPAGYEEIVKESWMKVQPTEKVFCLGDVCMGKRGQAHEQYVMPMPGYKILILGNHDNETEAWYLSHGWDEVHQELKLKIGWRRVLLSHKPKKDDGSFDINIHGHFHNDQHRASEPKFLAMKSHKHKLLALECVGYQLVPIVDFAEGKIEQPGLPKTT